MSVCPMGGCDEPPVTKFCAVHTARLRDNPDWIPLRLTDNEAYCGLCGHPVTALRRNGEPDSRWYYLELPAYVGGRCRIENGGFTVLSEEDAERIARRGEPPLYRSHPPVCPGRAVALRDAVPSDPPC